uniref:PCI domain-containing protein n=1 Tax=Astyanax mexicanus TaxID=7994 RepID=A0A8B9HP68_ASTMX
QRTGWVDITPLGDSFIRFARSHSAECFLSHCLLSSVLLEVLAGSLVAIRVFVICLSDLTCLCVCVCVFFVGLFSSERAASLPELTPSQRNKLRHLSIISLASNLKCLPYSLLLQQLELKNVRELEDLLIEAVYCDIIHGKLDQRNQQVEVDFSVGRDLGPNELPNIANTLQEWCAGCEAVLCGIEEQVSRANQYRESQLKVKVQVETEVSNLQKTLKASSTSPSSGPAPVGAASNQDVDQPAEPRDPASSQEPRQPGKKSSKVKG